MSRAIELITVIQQRLNYLGYYHSSIDGEEGPATDNAISAFKRNHGLNPRPKIGPLTITAIFSEDAKKAPRFKNNNNDFPWMIEARSLVGTREVLGKNNNPIIMDWARDLDQWYPGDDLAWCGLFMAHCMKVGSPEEPRNFNILGARAWRAFGKEVPPSYGCIGVFWREHPTQSYYGHVAFILAEYDDYFVILGGNQNNSVSISKIAKNRLLVCRAPHNFIETSLPRKSLNGALSTNEA